MKPLAGHLGPARVEIDRIDRRLVALLARRQAWVETIALLKGDPAKVHDPQRARAVLRRVRRRAIRTGLNSAMARTVWQTLMERCAAHETALLQTIAERRMTYIKADAPGGR